MNANFKITADGKDVTDAIARRFISLKIQDERGWKSDTLEIVIDDRPDLSGNYIEMPKTGVQLEVELGRGSTLHKMGSFTVNETRATGAVEKLTINATAADMKGRLKEKRTRGLDNISFGDLAATIASEHVMTAKVSASISNTIITRIDQLDESDLHLMTRISRSYGTVIKYVGSVLIIVPKGEAKTVSGEHLPSTVLNKNQLAHWALFFADRDQYESVVAKYHDNASASDIRVTAGSGRSPHIIRRAYASEQEAILAAEAKLKELNRGLGQGSISTDGDARLVAEAQVTLKGMRPGLDGVWQIKTATHTLNKSRSWSADLELEMNPK